MIGVSYAQNYEDVMLGRALAHVERGFYIDVGAQDPVQDSVTKAFYEKGWRGINIEPVPRWHERLVADRPGDINLRVAVSDREGELRLTEVLDSGLSTSREEFVRQHVAEGRKVHAFVVPCRPLDAICREHGVTDIHFLKVDCEGAELQALKSIDLAHFRPWIIVVEATIPNTQVANHEEWEPVVLEGGYSFVYADGLNRFYVADEHRELAQAFAFPPNVFDRFVPAAQENLLRETNRLREDHAASLSRQQIEHQTQVQALQKQLRGQQEKLRGQQEKLRGQQEQLRGQQEQLHGLRKELESRVRELAQLRQAHNELSVRYSRYANAPHRRAGRKVFAIARRVLGPLARRARPFLRWLGGHAWLKAAVLKVLGRDSYLAHQASLFLRNAGGQAPVDGDVDSPVEHPELAAQSLRVYRGLVRLRKEGMDHVGDQGRNSESRI